MSNNWDDFKQILNDFCLEDFNFSVICLQEIWSLNPAFNFTLEGYSPLYYKLRSEGGENQVEGGVGENGTEIRGKMKQFKVKGKGLNSGPRGVGGGVGIFIDRKYESEIVQEVSVFESLFVKVKLSENKNLLIGNIYRPPQTSIRDFTEILNTVLVQIREDTNLKHVSLFL